MRKSLVGSALLGASVLASVALFSSPAAASPAPPPVPSSSDVRTPQQVIGSAPALGNKKPAATPAASGCMYFDTDTGSGLNMKTMMRLCGSGSNYISEIQGYVKNNSSDYAHAGHVRTFTLYHGSRNNQWEGGSENLAPGATSTTWVVNWNNNMASGTRVCVVWVMANGQETTGYACANVG